MNMLNNFFSSRLNILRKNVATYHLSHFLYALFIVTTILSCTESTTSGFKESDDLPTEEIVFITTTSLPDGKIGIAYSVKLSATGGDGNYVWEISSGDLPQGLDLDANTGEISGKPELDGDSNLTIKVSSAGMTDSKSLSIAITPAVAKTNRQAVINVDFMDSILEEFGDEVYVGDDGVLSSEDGIFWNPADDKTGSLLAGALDEFGEPTYVEMTADFIGGTFIGAATNELQDNGVSSGGIADNAVEWKGLLADAAYDLAFYVYHENSIEQFTTLKVTHAGGEITLTTTDDSTWELLGEKDRDYFLLEDMAPYEIADGTYGFRIDNLNDRGSIVGLQLKGLVPAPAQ